MATPQGPRIEIELGPDGPSRPVPARAAWDPQTRTLRCTADGTDLMVYGTRTCV